MFAIQANAMLQMLTDNHKNIFHILNESMLVLECSQMIGFQDIDLSIRPEVVANYEQYRIPYTLL